MLRGTVCLHVCRVQQIRCVSRCLPLSRPLRTHSSAMRHLSTTAALTVLQSSALMLLLLLGAHCVSADYAPCSDPATCGAINNCCTTLNGVDYCCPGAGNSFNSGTRRCENFAQCGQYYALQRWVAPRVCRCSCCVRASRNTDAYLQYRLTCSVFVSCCVRM